MKLSTLKEIEKLLVHNVEDKELMYKKAGEKVVDLEYAQAEEREDFSIDELKYWEKTKMKHWQKMCSAKEALQDFLEHDWN